MAAAARNSVRKEEMDNRSDVERGFDEIARSAQQEMAKWPQERRDAVQLQGVLHYSRLRYRG